MKTRFLELKKKKERRKKKFTTLRKRYAFF